jgi:hypothetical protein
MPKTVTLMATNPHNANNAGVYFQGEYNLRITEKVMQYIEISVKNGTKLSGKCFTTSISKNAEYEIPASIITDNMRSEENAFSGFLNTTNE